MITAPDLFESTRGLTSIFPEVPDLPARRRQMARHSLCSTSRLATWVWAAGGTPINLDRASTFSGAFRARPRPRRSPVAASAYYRF